MHGIFKNRARLLGPGVCDGRPRLGHRCKAVAVIWSGFGRISIGLGRQGGVAGSMSKAG